MNEAVKLEEGMLLLANEPGLGVPFSIYTVASKDGKTLMQSMPNFLCKKKLTKPELPEGWRVLDNRELARLANEAS